MYFKMAFVGERFDRLVWLQVVFVCLHQALGLKRDDTFSVTMLGHCIEMYIGDTDAYIGLFYHKYTTEKNRFLW